MARAAKFCQNSRPKTSIEDVKLRCMQETDCVLKEGEYRKLVFDMRKKGQLERLDTGRMTKDARFRVKPRS